MPELLTLDRRDDGVAVVTLANGKVNALSQALVTELRDAATELSGTPPGAVVITGGDRIFAAGADISEFGGTEKAGPITALIHGALDAIAALPAVRHRLGLGLRPGRRLRVGPGLRLPRRRPEGGVRSARDPPRRHSRWRGHAAPGPARRAEHGQGAVHHRAPSPGRGGVPHRACRRGRGRHPWRAPSSWRPWSPAGRCRRRRWPSRSSTLDSRPRWRRGCKPSRPPSSPRSRTEDSQIGVASFLEHGPGKAAFTGR